MKILALLAVTFSLALTAGLAAATLQGGPPQVKPGPEHAVLQRMVGEWDVAFRMTMPGMPQPMESKSTATRRLELGGLWLFEDYADPNMMGMPFQGLGITGWDAEKKKYVGVWIDNTSTRLSLSEGTYDADKKTLTMIGEGPDPFGQPARYRTEVVFESADVERSKVWMEYAGGAEPVEFISMRMTRRKE